MSIRFGRHITSNKRTAFNREWLVTNGLGGYATGTIGGARTRRYHGLLIAAMGNPVARHLLLADLDMWLEINNRRFPLTTHQWAAGVIFPDGYNHLEAFSLEGAIPVFRWSVGFTTIEQRIWMGYEHNTTYITWRLVRGMDPVKLYLKPLVTYRSHHDLSTRRGTFNVTENPSASGDGVQLDILPGYYLGDDGPETTPSLFHLYTNTGTFKRQPDWWVDFSLMEEEARGLAFQESLFQPGNFEAILEPGQTFALIATTELETPPAYEEALRQEVERQNHVLAAAAFKDRPEWIEQLILAADQFIVRDENTGVRHIITGYPWYGVWGRSTMSSLTGLTVIVGQRERSEDILRGFATYLDDGMLPNIVNDDREQGVYNTIDASLWYFVALWAHMRDFPADTDLLETLYPTLIDIIKWHARGTRYQIGEDETDGLLYGGEEGVQLTWMDVKIEDMVITPRTGKDVEVNALWYNALRITQQFAETLGITQDAQMYAEKASRVLANFATRFWSERHGYLYDVIDMPDHQSDHTLRPNQLLALSLPYPLITDPDQTKQIVDTCARRLLTTYGLRTLEPDDVRYAGMYQGPQVQRDYALHMGTVWSWLMGPFISAHLSVYKDTALARDFLNGYTEHLYAHGAGSVSELFDGNPPHRPRGAIASAWGVAEILRVWREIERYENEG